MGKFFCLVLAPLANAINWWNLLCCFLCLAYGMQPPALRTVVALAIWGMLKLWTTMEWLGCMDMLSGGNFADGSCCHSLAKFGFLPLRSRH